MDHLLTVASFNANGLRANVDKVRALCCSCDIIFLQELLVLPVDLPLLNSVHEDFFGAGVSSMDCEGSLLRGRPTGGCGVLWRKALGPHVALWRPSGVEEVIGIVVGPADNRVLLAGVYLRPDKGTVDDFVRYEESLDCLALALSECGVQRVLCVGDFNADVKRRTRFYGAMLAFAEELGLQCIDITRLPDDTFTYLSPSHGTVSWIDHVLSSESLVLQVSSIEVLLDVSESDHMPLVVRLSGVEFDRCVASASFGSTPRPGLCQASEDEVCRYVSHTAKLCRLLLEAPLCLSAGCEDNDHKKSIDVFCDNIVEGLVHASDLSLACSTHGKGRHYYIPGWNSEVKGCHREARAAFLAWRTAGSPPVGLFYDTMVRCRRVFKTTLRRCRSDAERHRQERIASSLASGNPRDFWREIRRSVPKVPLANSVDGTSGEPQIADLWSAHFSRLFSKSFDEVPPNSGAQSLTANLFITPEMCRRALDSLNSAASPGLDGLNVSNFRKASSEIFDALACAFNSMLCHGHVPCAISDSVMVPIPKGRLNDMSVSSSYRGIALTSVMSKILEMVIVENMSPLLGTSDVQFAYKTGHSTLDAVFVLKETVSLYTSEGSPVYAAFLDLQKAFDSVDHVLLIDCLRRRNWPPNVSHLIWMWLSTQRMCVRWGDSLSAWFPVGRGVRQGGCLSPLLFTIFIDDMLEKVHALPAGCSLGGVKTSILAYADDIVLLAPSLSGLQRLVRLCVDELYKLGLQLNTKKSVCMAFQPKLLVHAVWASAPTMRISGGDECLQWVDSFTYLGVCLLPNGGCQADMTRARRSFLRNVNVLIRKFGGCSLATRKRLFMAFCTCFYGCGLWSDCLVRDLRLLEVTVHSAMKKLLGLPRFVSSRLACLELGVPPLPQFLAAHRLTLMKRLMRSDNPTVCAAIQGVRWGSSSYLASFIRMCATHGVVHLSFTKVDFSDVCDMFLWEAMRSLEVRPPHVF